MYQTEEEAVFVLCVGNVWVQGRPGQYLEQQGILDVWCRHAGWMFLFHQGWWGIYLCGQMNVTCPH